MPISFSSSASNQRTNNTLEDVLYRIRLMKKEKCLQQSWLKMIVDSGNQLSEMIENSLDTFKMEENTYVFTPSPCNLADIFNKLARDLDSQIRKKNISLEVFIDGRQMLPEGTFWVSGEFRLLQNLFGNLLKNAIEASPEDEKVRVDFDPQQKDMFLIRINNKGVVPEILRDRFFDRYATHGKKSGTGLGTYSAKLIAKTHRGNIRFETDETSGTTLFVLLPSSPEPEPDKEHETDSFSLKKVDFTLQGTILMAEDNPINQQVIKGLMEDHDILLDIAENGQEVVQIQNLLKYDLILMDMEMPVMDGSEAIQIIRKQYAHDELPILSLTAHDLALSEINQPKIIINDVISKPIQPDHFFKILRKYLKSVPVTQTLNNSEPEKRVLANDILNLDRALQQLMGKRHLLENIMQSFKKEYFNAPEAIKKLIENKQFQSAQRKIHTIKGLAGTIGAPMLQKAAQDLENAITDRMLPGVNQLISSFRQNLDPVIETIEKLLPGSPKESVEPSLSNDLAEQLTLLEKNLDRFYELLLDSDSEANDACDLCYSALSYLTQNTDDRLLLDQLKQNMKNYLFDDAATILKTLTQKLGLELQTH
ncbi:MAG: response regulator [Candidatus Magnetomorum sp.]|nr:response regulator [Candidatus Magnetomorum sp.]